MNAKLQIKICGITNVDDARWAANLGANYIGLNFYSESPRKVSAAKAKEIVESLPPFVKSVGIFVNSSAGEICKISAGTKLFAAQLHGDETPEFVTELKTAGIQKVWKAFRVKDEQSLEQIAAYQGLVDAILLDAFKEDIVGGTGETFNWDLAAKAKIFSVTLFLAGGLTPDNVAEAVETVEPAGVDAASGVEKDGHPRRKDMEKMKNFILRARSA